MPIVVILVIAFVFIYWENIVAFFFGALVYIVLPIGGLVLLMYMFKMIIPRKPVTPARESPPPNPEPPPPRIEPKGPTYEYKTTPRLHIKLDLDDRTPTSARVTNGAFKGRDVASMSIEELYDFRNECFKSRDKESLRTIATLKRKTEKKGWAARIVRTKHFEVLLDERKEHAIRATFKFHTELRPFAGRELKDLTFEEIAQYRKEFAGQEKMAEQVFEEVLGLSTQREPSARPQADITVFTGLSANMTVQDAYEILGMESASRSEAHKRRQVLHQRVHPDKIGGHRLSQLVNQAIDRLQTVNELPPIADLQAPGSMTLREAKEILGLDEEPSIADINQSSHDVVGKVHPGIKGGCRRLEQLVLQARELLLEHHGAAD